MVNIDFLIKYEPTTYKDLVVPECYKNEVENMFTGKLNLSAKGYVICGGYGLGKTTLVSLLKSTTKWPCFTLPDKSSANSSTIDKIRNEFYFTQNINSPLFNNEWLVEPPRFIIECHEISQSSVAFLNSLTQLIDEFYEYSKKNKDAIPALWLFTDNFQSNLVNAAGGVFSPGRIRPLDWSEITKDQVNNYAREILKKEGLYNDDNLQTLNDIVNKYKNDLRSVLAAMSINIEG